MPVTVTVRAARQGDAEPALTFDAPRVVIGRSPSCDVRLPDATVSQRHAVLTARGAEFQIIDEGSTNGTFIGGIQLAPRAPRTIRSGDFVRVGRVWLEVRVEQRAPTADIAGATRDLALALVQQAMVAQGRPTAPAVSVVEGPDQGATLALAEDGRIYIIGRGEECDLALADADASREHLQVVRRAAVVLLRDLRSKNGSMLGEQPISSNRDVPWRAALMVRVGTTVLALDEPLAQALGVAEKAPDELLAENDAPAPPPVPEHVGVRQAPIAHVARSLATASTARRSRLRLADVLIVGSALAIIALSIVALIWVLK